MRFSSSLLPVLALAGAVSAGKRADSSSSSAPKDATADSPAGLRSWFQSAQAAFSNRLDAFSDNLFHSFHAPSPLHSSPDGAGSDRPKPLKGIKRIEVRNFTMDHWKDTLLVPAVEKPGQTAEWMVLMTGGEKTCQNQCENVTKAWEESIPLFSALPHPPHLGLLDCDAETDLCHSWGAGPAGLWHFLITVDPAELKLQRQQTSDSSSSSPSPSRPPFHSSVRLINLNRVNTTKTDLVRIYTEETWKQTPILKSKLFHPFDGLIAQYGLERMASKVITFAGSPLPWVIVFMLTRVLFSYRAGSKRNVIKPGVVADDLREPALEPNPAEKRKRTDPLQSQRAEPVIDPKVTEDPRL